MFEGIYEEDMDKQWAPRGRRQKVKPVQASDVLQVRDLNHRLVTSLGYDRRGYQRLGI